MQSKKGRQTEDHGKGTKSRKNPGNTAHTVNGQHQPIKHKGHAWKIAHQAKEKSLSGRCREKTHEAEGKRPGQNQGGETGKVIGKAKAETKASDDCKGEKTPAFLAEGEKT